MFKKDTSLNEKRLECAIKSMALAAHYIGGADRNFDTKEKEQAADLISLRASWSSLFYTKEKLDEEQESNLEMRLNAALDELSGDTSNRSGLMKKLEEQYKVANTLFKYSYEKLEKMDRKNLLKIINEEGLDIEIDEFDDDEEGLEYLMEEVFENENLAEPFPYRLKDVLAQYGIFIAMASGGFLGYKKISKAELKAIEEIEEAWGGSEFSIMIVMHHAKAIYKIRHQIRLK